MTLVTDEILPANEQYATDFDKGALPMPPGRKFAVVTCMDARLDPARFLGLEEATRTSSGTPAASSPTTPCARS